jgi:hypothetical protein
MRRLRCAELHELGTPHRGGSEWPQILQVPAAPIRDKDRQEGNRWSRALARVLQCPRVSASRSVLVMPTAAPDMSRA